MEKKVAIKKAKPKNVSRRTVFRTAVSFSYDASATRNPNWRSRCGCDQTSTCNTLQWGQSYIRFNNQSGRYKIRVYLRSYGKQTWWNPNRTFAQNWDLFVAAPSTYIRFTSGIIEPRASAAGYFRNGNNDTSGGGQAGTIGIEIFDTNGVRVNRIFFWPPNWDPWGMLWMRCGHDYNFNFFEK